MHTLQLFFSCLNVCRILTIMLEKQKHSNSCKNLHMFMHKQW